MPPLPALPSWSLTAFKALAYGLLTLNVALLYRAGRLPDALDALGWLILVLVMEFETRGPPRRHGWAVQYAALVIRLIGYGLIFQAWALFLAERRWLDLANTTLWLLVCAALEFDIFLHPRLGRHARAVRDGVKLALYAGLLACAAAWGLRGDWLSFYDAALWLLAFFALELNVFGWAQTALAPNLPPAPAPSLPPPSPPAPPAAPP